MSKIVMTQNLQMYWTAALEALLVKLESTPDIDGARLSSWKSRLNAWRTAAEASPGEVIDVTKAVGLYQSGRRLLPEDADLPPEIVASDVVAQTAVNIAGTTAATVAGVCLVVGLVIYGLSR